jgi:hypothetical protein
MDIAALLRKSAKSALFSWKQDEDGVEDLINDLWVWYLESPATQRKLQESDEPLARSLAYKAALQILAKNALSNDKFSGRNIYSSDSVRAALRGQSKNRYLVDILPRALKSLDAQNSGYAEALRSRYIDGTVPEVHSAVEKKLSRAVKSLTEHVNIIAITAGVDSKGNVNQGPGSRSAMFPETRRSKGNGHADPTADTAILLIEHPELREEYLYEEPLEVFLRGRGNAQLD